MRRLAAGLVLTFLAAACGGGDGSSGPEPVTAVTITTPSTVVTVSRQPVQLAATVVGSSGNALSGRAITWTSSNEQIATVTPTGLVTAVGEGTVTITATSEGRQGTIQLTARFPYPNVSGTYTLVATFTGLPGAGATGTITLVQASRTSAVVTGVATVRATVGTSVSNLSGLYDATVDSTGVVQFYIGAPASAQIGSVYWLFVGQPGSGGITGTHTLGERGGDAFRGTFVLARSGMAALRSEDASADRRALLDLRAAIRTHLP